ncbi:alanine--tRNA ligase [Acidithiobacillus ferrianus]|uniref:Alanine--tRNA ligase n=2 Tax=Acidithiobacillus ferrianus TaxID=2678518 RepID=A0A845UCD1_9PROT|nr:alanine--tRNA ligase [Acidithiobacillus ferrianus]NDU43417.1 alanine--tRNA ligase [Acidithiobacillus ferrianus]
MHAQAIRQTFLDYFVEQGHQIVPSSPLIPRNDPTLLFTNAGMVPFKDVFLGLESRPYRRAVSSQRCMRAGGKHNDLENVGYTARHHTFFEMLGNFSFGDYFKREAIAFAWRFLTERLGLPPERLWITVYEEDHEAAALWINEIGIDPQRLSRCGEKDNFWSMGDTGPCGPCSEIFYDHGPHIPGGPPGSPEADGDRYIEIWNLVFMQFDRDSGGTLTPLPRPSVDTGMGLERLAAVLQGVHNNYETDLFKPLIAAATEISGRVYGGEEATDTSLRVLADHIRACGFLITDGVLPANEGRGYVLRRIIRRAVRHGRKLGMETVFFHRLVAPLVAEMGGAFPELARARSAVEQVLIREETRFRETLERGLSLLEEAIAGLAAEAAIPGEIIFRLADTFGFPVDLTADIARERGRGMDMEGYALAMAAQRSRSRAAWAGSGEVKAERVYHDLAMRLPATVFTGYEACVSEGKVMTLIREGEEVAFLEAGDAGEVILDRTPFYGESGGQAGDRGELRSGDARFVVNDTQKPMGHLHVHLGRLTSGRLQAGDAVRASVDEAARRATAAHHSATHLLHAALRDVLGSHVQQKGSLVDPERLRFDFSQPEPVTAAQLREIERMVNAAIRHNVGAETRVLPMAEAQALGAVALFGEKYADEVRVVRMGDFSMELCGGTHVEALGDIGVFKILGESGVAAGIRRIEAVAGAVALAVIQRDEERLQAAAGLLKVAPAELDQRLAQTLERLRQLEKELEKVKREEAARAGADLAAEAEDMGGVPVLIRRLEGMDGKALRDALDRLRARLPDGVIVLAGVEGEKVALIAGVGKGLTGRIDAGALVNTVAQPLGGKGGGRPDMAQAGAGNPAALDAALDAARDWVRGRLS